MLFPYCFFKDSIIPVSEAHISVQDLGVLRGYAIFDYLCAHNGKPFLLEEHLNRFFNSAARMYLQSPQTRDNIKQIIASLLSKNEAAEAGIRIVLTGGNSPDGFNPGPPLLFITIESIPPALPDIYEKGVALMTHEHLRPYAETKTNNYITAVYLQAERARKNAFDILYTHRGNILECVRSNFFLVKEDTLITPQSDVLIGMTRRKILELANRKYKVEEREISIAELKEASEAFLTGTSKRVIPVVSIDGKMIGSGKPGPVTLDLLKMFDQLVNDFAS